MKEQRFRLLSGSFNFFEKMTAHLLIQFDSFSTKLQRINANEMTLKVIKNKLIKFPFAMSLLISRED